MAKIKGLFNEIVQAVSLRLTEDLKTVQQMNQVPIGQEYMTPRQVKERYGLGVREINDLMRMHGENTIKELLDLIDRSG